MENLQEISLVAKVDAVENIILWIVQRKQNLVLIKLLNNETFQLMIFNLKFLVKILLQTEMPIICFFLKTYGPQTDQGSHLVWGDLYEPANTFDATQNISAGYISNEFSVSEKLKAVVGLRAELFSAIYTGQNQAATEIFVDEKIIDKLDLFPSANFIYSLNDNSNLRVSYSRTTARPSFKEASKSQIFDPITNRLFIGNIDLEPSYISNFDIRTEFFGENSEMFAISGFYKDFKDPIELTFYESAPDQLTPRNLGNASVFGIEFECEENLLDFY